MKKCIDIISEYRRTLAAAESLEKEIANAPRSLRDSALFDLAHKSDELQLLRIECKVIYDNARRALVNEVVPVAVEIWNSYAGKKYGPKTKDKIRDEMQQATGQYISVNTSRYGNNYEMVIYHDSFRYDDLCIRSEWENGSAVSPFISEKNKILPVEIEKLYLCDCGAYCGDYVGRAEKIVAAFRDLREESRKFETACKEFNILIPSGMKRAYPRDFSDYLNSYI